LPGILPGILPGMPVRPSSQVHCALAGWQDAFVLGFKPFGSYDLLAKSVLPRELRFGK
jgi:hypothetical protein